MPKHNTRRRRILALVAATGLGLALLQPPATALAANIFEVDGNSVDATNVGGDDWDTLYADTTGPAGSSTAFTGIIADGTPDTTTFTGGGSKDDIDVPSWRYTSGSSPDKSEIVNAYAAAYLAPDGADTGTDSDLVLYFGSDRAAVNGSANVGFWFTKQKVAPVAGGGFSGVHQTGDTLVLSEFTNGGSVPGVQVWQWDPTATGATCPSTVTATNIGCKDNDGTLKLLLIGAGACATANACAAVNSAETTVSWPYLAKGSTRQGKVPAGGFIEGGINLSALSGGATPCLSNFVAETRSSPSTDAVLLDFVRGDFPLCGASIGITGNDINEVNDPHTFTVTANKLFGGSPSPSTDAHVDFALTAANGATPVVNTAASTCDDTGPNVNASGQCTIVFTSATVGTVTGSATATVPLGGQNYVVSTNGLAGNSGTVLKRFVDSRIILSPLTDTNGITENHVVTADVDVNLGDGNGWVAATAGHVDVTTTASAGAAVAPNVTGTTCHVSNPPDPTGANNLDANGRCTVAFTSNSSGTVTVHATVNLSVTVGGFTEAMTRSSDGSGGNSADATKDFVDGSLKWLKHDDQGTLLGGATFSVCRTHTFSSATSTMVDTIPDVCVTVVDNSAPDTDSIAGKFQMDDLVLGRYTIRETVAPDGYQIDPDTETVDITIANPNGTAPTFVDPALFKVIVLTCNTTTEALVDSTVDLAPGTPGGQKGTLTSPPTGLTEAQLCALGGANYDDLTRNNYDLQVELPDQAPLFP